VRAKRARQRFLVASPIDRHCPESLPGCELYAEVAEAADPVDGHEIAGLRAGIPKRV
jgi:hypothetical protein